MSSESQLAQTGFAAPVSRREQAKQGRRRALLAAARASLSSGEFSMRRVAELAGVAEVTPYNLFGSKAGLLNALYGETVRAAEARLPPPGTIDPLSRVLAAIDGFRDDLAANPAFLRAIFAARSESRGGRSYAEGFDEGVDYWQRLIAAAIESGQIRAGPSANLLPRHFVHLLSGTMLEWIDHAIDADEWHGLLKHGFALLVMSLASDEAAALLTAGAASVSRP